MLPAGVRIFLCTVPQDMRRSFDGLALAAQQIVGEDPQSGALYVFVSRRATRVKILWWDHNGYCLLGKGFTALCSGCRRPPARPVRRSRSTALHWASSWPAWPSRSHHGGLDGSTHRE